MKKGIILSLILTSMLMSCSTNEKNNTEEEHEENNPEGIVILNEKQREALELEIGYFQMRNLTTVVKTNGQLEVPPTSKADVTAIIGGNVLYINVFHGDKVKKGQLLAVLEHPDYITLQEDFAVVANNIEYLEKEYERQKELYDNNVGSGKEYQKISSEYNMAKVRYEGLYARLKLLHISPQKVLEGSISNTINIISPIDGYVNEININMGKYVDAKDNLLEITDISSIHADFLIYEKDVYLIKEGQKVHFTVSNQPGQEHTAIIFAVGKEFESNTRAIHIHAHLENITEDFIPGMYISGHLHTDENYSQALPNNAIVTEGTKSFIFIVDNEDYVEENSDEQQEVGNESENNNMAFKMIEVFTGQSDDGFTEVILLDTLEENTQIVLNAAYYLLADMKKGEVGDDD